MRFKNFPNSCGRGLSPLGTQNKDLGAASQALITSATQVKLK